MNLFNEASLYISPNATKAGKLYAVKPTDGSGDLTVTRATSATRVNASGVIETVGANVARLDYSNGTCPSILVEPQRTNLVLSSEDFTNATYWNSTGDMITTANQSISPSGLLNADLFYDSGSRNKFVSSPVSSYLTFSCYFKRVDVTNVLITASDFYSGDVSTTFNLVALTSSSAISGDWSNNTTKIESVGNGWYRCSVTALRGSGGSGIQYRIECGEIQKSFYAWGYQLEAGSYATSYIPTTSASVTRNADVISKTGISSLFGTNKGTVFCDFVAANIQGTSQYIFDTSDGSNATTNRFAFYKITAGSYELFTNTATSVSINSNTRNKVAITWNGSSVKVYANGALKNSITYANANPTQINLGTRFNNVEVGDVNYNSYCIFPTDLTDAQLIELTTI